METGDFVKIDFTGKVIATGDVFDTTNEEEAKKLGIHNKGQRYGPMLAVVGESMVPPGVDDALKEMKVGEEKEFDLEPEKSFGPRSPKLVKIMSLTKFHEKKVNPVPGIFLEIEGMQAKVRSVSGGRVVMDFNHPLAGRELHYRLKITEKVTEPLEKVKSLLNHYQIPAEPSLKEGVLTLKTKIQEGMLQAFIESRIQRFIKEVKEVKIEPDKTKAEPEKPKAEPEKAKETPAEAKKEEPVPARKEEA